VLGQNPVDIVLTDINMPNMNGVELLSAIKRDDKLKSTAVLMITTEARAETVLDAAQKGAVGYIKKPFTPSEIQDQLMPVLKARVQ
jgi:two-component system chemotaxis response regulator CheY